MRSRFLTYLVSVISFAHVHSVMKDWRKVTHLLSFNADPSSAEVFTIYNQIDTELDRQCDPPLPKLLHFQVSTKTVTDKSTNKKAFNSVEQHLVRFT